MIFLKKKYIKKPRVILGILFGIICFSLFFFFILRNLPSPTRLNSPTVPQSSQIFDRNDVLLYTIYGSKNQTFIPLTSIPKYLQYATIATEDRDFYRHGAIDIRGIVRAFYSTLFRKQLQGGSTLTQQLVKNSLLTPEQTITRKIKEVLLAFATELIYPKNKILEMYLNQSPYGGTAWGVEAASQTYFGKNAKGLDLAESALIAGLTEAPSIYSPSGSHPELSKKRQETVLSKMQEQGYISKKEKDQAVKEQLIFKNISTSIRAPHFVLYVKDLLEKKYGQEAAEQGGLKVKTSLDIEIQDFAQGTVSAEIEKLKASRVGNGALLVTNPATGEILAMVGSKNYFDKNYDGNVNVTLALRQPGSSIKPINYATGLLNGYTAATPFVDKRSCFPNPGKADYCPVNYDGKWHGVVQVRNALGSSINVPAVKMLKLNGVSSMITTALAMGITTFSSPDRYGLSLTLGGGEVSMVDLSTAYGVFANGGYRIDLHPILKVTNNQGKILEEYFPPPSPIFGKKVLPSSVAFIISQILMDNGAREMAFGPASLLVIKNRPVSVKTGTTDDLRDNWTIGYTPSILTAVWVGNNDNSPMSPYLVSGVTGAAPIWNKIMTHLLENKAPELPQQPQSVVGKHVCSTSGLIPPPEGTPDRCQTRYEYFVKGTEPTKVDQPKQKVFIDKTTNDLANPGQTDNVEEKEELIVTDPLDDRYCLSCPHPQPEEKK